MDYIQPLVGSKAPEFHLEAFLKGRFIDVALKDYYDRWLLLFFYPADFTFV